MGLHGVLLTLSVSLNHKTMTTMQNIGGALGGWKVVFRGFAG